MAALMPAGCDIDSSEMPDLAALDACSTSFDAQSTAGGPGMPADSLP
jgi:hypothetical protein